MLVSSDCYQCDEMIDGKVLCVKGHPSRHPPFFSIINTQGLSLHKNLLVYTKCATLSIIYMERTLHPVLYGPLHSRNEYVYAYIKGRDVPISTLFEAHGLSRNVKREEGNRGRAKGGAKAVM